MHRNIKFVETDSMSLLVNRHYHVLLLMSRFGIKLGFGDKTIKEVCEDNSVDTNTFMAVVNMLIEGGKESKCSCDKDKLSITTLLDYLHNSHNYFLGFKLPAIRAKLVEIVGGEDQLSRAIISYFDEYVAEVNRHMKYEEQVVFPYVNDLINGGVSDEYSIEVFQKQHDMIEERLSEFKNIMIKYYSAESTNEINNVLFDIFNCEYDLALHNAVEDYLFVPAIEAIEEKMRIER